MKEKIYCNWLKISLGIIFLGIILDIGVAVTDISLFTVTESYMDYIFAAIVSVGLLSFSIIALVVGILQEKFYGYKLRELLTFDGLKKRINLKRYIRISLLWIVLGIVLLSLYFKVSCVNTMICLLLATIFSAGCMAYSVFDIMVNDESVQKTLKDGYESLVKKDFNKNRKISYHINTLTNALIESCKKLNIEEMEELCTLYSTLMHVVDKNVDMSWEQEKFIETRLQQVCCNISIEFGYNKMLEQIVDMFNGISKYDYWKEDLYLKPIYEIAGYLKVSAVYPQNDGNFMCDVAIPNKEIAFVYEKEILNRTNQNGVSVSISQAVFSGNAQKLQDLLEDFMLRSISSMDGANEGFYHGMMLGLCAVLGNRYRIRSNREAGLGRFDIQLSPLVSGIPGFLFEFKHTKDERVNLAVLADSVLQQINEKKYDTELRNAGVNSIIKIGIAFRGKNAVVKRG